MRPVGLSGRHPLYFICAGEPACAVPAEEEITAVATHRLQLETANALKPDLYTSWYSFKLSNYQYYDPSFAPACFDNDSGLWVIRWL